MREALKICSIKKKYTEAKKINKGGTMTNRDPEDKDRENHRFLQIAFTEAGVITVKKVDGVKRGASHSSRI